MRDMVTINHTRTYVRDFPSARVWLVLYSRTQGNIIMWRTPYFYFMRSHMLLQLHRNPKRERLFQSCLNCMSMPAGGLEMQ